jgi:hypothetical protein
MRLQDKTDVERWQQTLCHLICFMLRHGMPMEKLDPRPSFYEENRQARNAEEALLVVLNTCAKVTEKLSQIKWHSPEAFGTWISRLCGQRVDGDIFYLNYLSFLDLQDCILDFKDFYGANLERANLERANLERANLERANLERANLDGANLHGANLHGTNLHGTNLHGANLHGANLERANLERANLLRANLEGANLDGANLDGANLERANLVRANLDGANLDGANLVGANLVRANLVGARNLDKANLKGTILEGKDLSNWTQDLDSDANEE